MSERLRLDLTRVVWMKVKRLYLQREWQPQAICEHLDIPPELAVALGKAISRRGWPKQRKDRVAALVNASPNPLTHEEQEEIDRIDAWRDQSAELVEKSFEGARKSVGGQDLKDYSVAARGFVDIYTKAGAMKSPEVGGLRVLGVALVLVHPDGMPNVPMKTAEPVVVEEISEDVGL